MFRLSQCPQCDDAVTIPDGLPAVGRVRCPHCDEEFAIAEILARAAPAPPAVILVAGHDFDADAGAVHLETAATLDDRRFSADAVVDSPGDLDAPPQEAAPADGDRSESDVPSSTWQPPAAETVDEAPEILVDSPLPADAASPQDRSAEIDVDPSDAAAAVPWSERARRNRRGKGPLRFVLEVVLGGVAGLLIGYYVLSWGFGSRLDLPRLPLPLLPHTVESDTFGR